MRIRKTGDFFARYFFREPRKRAGEKVTKSLLYKQSETFYFIGFGLLLL